MLHAYAFSNLSTSWAISDCCGPGNKILVGWILIVGFVLTGIGGFVAHAREIRAEQSKMRAHAEAARAEYEAAHE